MPKGAQSNMPGTCDDKREKCDEDKGDCGRVRGFVWGHERPGKNVTIGFEGIHPPDRKSESTGVWGNP